MLVTQTTTLSTVWLIESTDDIRLGFTNHDRPFTIDEVIYTPDSGIQLCSTVTSNTHEVDNTEIAGSLIGAAMKEDELRKGLWDAAKVKVGICDYLHLEDGITWYNVGFLGKINYQGGQFQTEIRGFTDLLRQPLSVKYSPGCRAQFGDKQCGYKPDSELITVYQVLDTARFYATFKLENIEQGTIVWQTGKNKGMTMDILDTKEDLIEVVIDAPYVMAIGDTALLYEDCDKSLECCVSFDNAINFRGEPHKPSQDKILIGPRG